MPPRALYPSMPWIVLFHPEFELEFQALPRPVRIELTSQLGVLEQFGPQLNRPRVDTLNGSRHSNMKELRFQAEGVWRFAFAFNSQRQAVVLVGGDKQGANARRFYKNLIRVADERFEQHVARLSAANRKG